MDYTVADLLARPAEWAAATAAVGSLVAPGGTLLVIGVYLPPDASLEVGPPFLLTHAEVAAFGADGLRQRGVVEAVTRQSEPPRYRAEFIRPAVGDQGTR